MIFENDKVITCNCCKKQWKLPESIITPRECPFCGHWIKDKTDPAEILERIIKDFGIEVLLDTRLFAAIVQDLYTNELHPIGVRIMLCQQHDILRKYVEAKNSTDALEKKRIFGGCRNTLIETWGLKKTSVNRVCKMFERCIAEEDDGKKEERIKLRCIASELYYSLGNDLWVRHQENLGYRVMLVAASAGNAQAQAYLLEDFDRLGWFGINYPEVLKATESLRNTNNHYYIAVIEKSRADDYAYGLTGSRDLEKAYNQYRKIVFKNKRPEDYRLEGVVQDAQKEVLFREYLGIGCKKHNTIKEKKKVDSLFLESFCDEGKTTENKLQLLLRKYSTDNFGGCYEKWAYWQDTVQEFFPLECGFNREVDVRSDWNDNNTPSFEWERLISKYVDELPADKYIFKCIARYFCVHDIANAQKYIEKIWKEYHKLFNSADETNETELGFTKKEIVKFILQIHSDIETDLGYYNCQEIMMLIERAEDLLEVPSVSAGILSLVLSQTEHMSGDDFLQLASFFETREADMRYQCFVGEHQLGKALLVYTSVKAVTAFFDNNIIISIKMCSLVWKLYPQAFENGSDRLLVIMGLFLLCGVAFERNIELGLRLIKENCDKELHNEYFLERLSALMKKDNVFGKTDICADEDVANRIAVMARETEDINTISRFGYDTSYTDLFASMTNVVSVRWVSFYDYESLGLSENDSRFDFCNLHVSKRIISLLEYNGYKDILAVNKVKMARIKEIYGMGRISAKKLQRALRDYYAELHWSKKNGGL